MNKKLLCLSIAVVLASCGGDDKNNNYNSGETGVFLDSRVAGIGYRTETKSGFTNVLGEYNYRPGETVTFFIGDLEFPPVLASGVVTPQDIAPDDEILRTNILQLLQTLDSDGNPDNGITIKEGAADAFAETEFDLESADFDTAVAATLTGLGLTLVSELDANAHFEGSLRAQLHGSWLLTEDNDMRNVLTFIDNERYIIIHEKQSGAQSAGSAEYGTYTWDPLTGDFTATVVSQSDADGGFNETSKLVIDGNSLVFTEGEELIVVDKVSSSKNASIGAWIMINPEDKADINVLTLLSATDYALVHTKNTEAYEGDEAQALSGEFGKYSLNGSIFRILSASVDTDGDGGLYNAENGTDQLNETLTVQPWGSLIFADGDEGEFSLVRLGQFVVDLVDNPDGDDVIGIDVYAALESVVALRDLDGFGSSSVENETFRLNVRFAEEFKEDCYVDFTDGTCGSAFEIQLSDDGTGQVTEVYERIESEYTEAQWPANWAVNAAGEIKVTFNPVAEFEGEDWVMTIARVAGSPTQLEVEEEVVLARPVGAIAIVEPLVVDYGVLVSLKGTWEEEGTTYVEDSLWLTTLEEIPPK
jgi:hypothetical protein